MGTKGQEIVKMDTNELIDMLNKAYADEWLAYYQYWVGAKVVAGPLRGMVEAELMEHAEEELKHADMLAERIIQLGGKPLMKPEDWMKETNCGYDEPKDEFTKTIVKQNIDGEQCAIDVYNKILENIAGKDPITFNMIRKIMEEEVEHEQDLQDILEDMDYMKNR